MKTKLIISAILFLSVISFFSSCDPENNPNNNNNENAKEVTISADITGTRRFVKDSVYILKGQINVTGTLNIDA